MKKTICALAFTLFLSGCGKRAESVNKVNFKPECQRSAVVSPYTRKLSPEQRGIVNEFRKRAVAARYEANMPYREYLDKVKEQYPSVGFPPR